MPLRGSAHSHSVRDDAPSFDTLARLDAWSARPHDKLAAVVPYQHRPAQPDGRPRLLICHDYKGGYTESPSALCYTFNFWRLCDTFVYFSHKRVAVPPSGWTNAAHKQGTKMLGTLIFEGMDGQADCIRIVVGPSGEIVGDEIPISKHYAVRLAELAHQRGFDGYLLNVESDLPYKTNHARALATWILLLRAELRARVGPHAEVVWYDSAMYNGHVSYQNRLNAFNLPFFLASDALFTNYWWMPDTQDDMMLYFAKLDYDLADGSTDTTEPKTLQSIYSGVDVWPGRGQYGDSGFCCYRAISYTAPLGFSTALFAPAWTWENATEEAERNWNVWWGNERKMWLGPLKPGETIPVPPCPEGPFQPMTAFFQDLPPPDPANFVFYTHFSPGVGYSWFVEGKKVLDTTDGWSDIDKQCSIGNLVWPWPTPSWQGLQQGAPPTASTALDMTDGYNGGNTLKLSLTYTGSASDEAVKSVWLPVQSLVLTTQTLFDLGVVHKVDGDVDPAIRVHVRPLLEEVNDAAFSTRNAIVSDLPRGWTQQTINFYSASTELTVSVAIGFLIDFKPVAPDAPMTFSLSLGQLAVFPTPPPPSVSISTPAVTSALFAPTPDATSALEGVLTWETSSTLNPIDVEIDDAESTTPAWLLRDTPAERFPAFAYFNVYAALPDDGGAEAASAGAEPVFIGTTGLDGRANRFYVERACFPADWDEGARLRFLVQGVTDRGEVLPWGQCATVEYQKRPARP